MLLLTIEKRGKQYRKKGTSAFYEYLLYVQKTRERAGLKQNVFIVFLVPNFMSFIRVKTIKGNRYAYLVENLYRKRGNPVKQKSKAYLGRIEEPTLTSHDHFIDWLGEDAELHLKKASPEQILDLLISWELWKHALDQKKIKPKKVLKLHDGYLCEYTRKQIIKTMHLIHTESKAEEEYEREHAISLAESFVKAGIRIPESVYIILFRKLHHKNL